MHWGRKMHTGFWLKKTEGNRPRGRPRHKWEGIIKLDFNK
jgi:hypothetical protein